MTISKSREAIKTKDWEKVTHRADFGCINVSYVK